MNSEIYIDELTKRYYCGFNVEEDDAIKIQAELNIKRNAKAYGYEILANDETLNTDSIFNFVITHPSKEAIEKMAEFLEENL
ncbi:hypothetical protein LF65_05671 [Clostridium beijerinckii]|uniref:Uncharacterized protein n=1 Tax=Clostridium beijerinckii TaxID=1520 RepID=A0A0B5QW64_CLOBE|nr:hypothetical protein [Clostridium beijerinckii]AJH02178.1 hypothetical protein LF65_05671 [Clostridium beijerinckii]